MKIRWGNPRQFLLLGLLALILVLALVKMRGGSPPAVSPATRATGLEGGAIGQESPAPAYPRSGKSEKKVSPEEVPIITTRDLESAAPRQRSEGRNIFDLRAPTLPPPPTPTPAPPTPPAPGNPIFIGPLLPPSPTPTPLPPEIPFKFMGTFGPKEQPIAVLLKGSEIVNAREGDVVFTSFIVRKIGYESVDIGFVGRDPKETRRLGITP